MTCLASPTHVVTISTAPLGDQSQELVISSHHLTSRFLPTTLLSPFDPGWFPTPSKENPARFVPIPLPPWLRPRDYTSKGDVVQSPLAYHPKNLLYDISFFGSWELFCDACHANRSNLYPDIPFKQFLPEFLWKEWDSLIEWKADFDSQLTPGVSKLQEFYSNPHIYLPFRLPSGGKSQRL